MSEGLVSGTNFPMRVQAVSVPFSVHVMMSSSDRVMQDAYDENVDALLLCEGSFKRR